MSKAVHLCSCLLFLCSFNHSHFLWWIYFQTLFSCWNMFWNFLLGPAVELIKKAFALYFSSNPFFRLQPAVPVIFLTVPCLVHYHTSLVRANEEKSHSTSAHSILMYIQSGSVRSVGEEQGSLPCNISPVSKQQINNACILHQSPPCGILIGTFGLRSAEWHFTATRCLTTPFVVPSLWIDTGLVSQLQRHRAGKCE